MLFVDDDQAEVLYRGEDRRARSDADARLAAAQPPPLVVALAVGEGGVQDGDAVAEPGAEAGNGLRGEADLGDEDDRPPSHRQRRLDRGEVDLGLARAGDAVQEQLAVARPPLRPVRRRPRRPPRPAREGASARLRQRPRRRRARPAAGRGAFSHPPPGGSTSRRPREGVEQYSRATQRPSRTSSAGTPVSSASIGSASRSGGISEVSASPTTTPSMRCRPNGTRTTLPTPTPAISAGNL